jgi:hypothetical protein
MLCDFFMTFYLRYTSLLKSTHISLCNPKFGKSLPFKQCSGSGSVGTVSFWASRSGSVIQRYGSGSFYHQAKIV